jgi:integrase
MTATELTPAGTSAALQVGAPLAADQNPAVVYLARLSPSSRRTMLQALARVAALATGAPEAPSVGASAPEWHERLAFGFAWDGLRRQHVAAIRARLLERYGLAAARTTLAALRGVLKEAWRLGLMAAEDYHRTSDVEGVKGSSYPRGRHLSPGELLALVSLLKADPSPSSARDAAVLAVMAAGGLRRAEVAALELSDFNSESGLLVVRCGKGRKARTVPLRNGSRQAVIDWLARRGADPGAMFYASDPAGRLVARPMTPDALHKLCARLGPRAGVPRFSPHDLRRTFAGAMLDAGADLSVVRALMGHASVTTTAAYDRRGEEAKARAAELLHFPY